MPKQIDEDDELSALREQMDEEERAAEEPADEPLLPSTHSFSIDVMDGRKRRYQGDFTATVPNLGMQVKVARMKASMLPGGSPADANGGMLAEMMAYTNIVLSKFPKWWKPSSFYDSTPLVAVYWRCREYEARFLGAPQSERDSRQDEGAAEEGTAPAGADDVVSEVPAAPKRRETLVAHAARSDRPGARAKRVG